MAGKRIASMQLLAFFVATVTALWSSNVVPCLCLILSAHLQTTTPPEYRGCVKEYVFTKKTLSGFLKDSIYIHSNILDAVQRLSVDKDQKEFVDRPTSRELSVVKNNFQAIEQMVAAEKNATSKKRLLESFVEQNFQRHGTEPRIIFPPHWVEKPSFLSRLHSTPLHDWALDVHNKWKQLFRAAEKKRLCEGCVSSFIHTKGSYFVVPGGRFREFFYWDSYWILKGLAASEMYLAIEEILSNLFSYVEEYGYVPNGSREYFLNRSQPPLLTMMVEFYTQECQTPAQRIAYLQKHICFLEKEYLFWMEKRRVDITRGKEKHVLNIYNSSLGGPRPEAYCHDMELVRKYRKTHSDAAMLFKHICAAAESGWDFSSRWMDKENTLEGMETADIIPVDLQAFLFQTEKILAQMWEELGNNEKRNKYKEASEKRKKAISLFLWDSSSFVWRDFNLVRKEFQRSDLYSSCLYPLYFGAFNAQDEKAFVKKVLSKHLPRLLLQGGIVASTVDSGQQWDSSNAWPVDQDFFVSFLRSKGYYGDKELKELALSVVQRWIGTTYSAWKKHDRLMFEKYNGLKVGEPGGMGEYVVQDGFGWTNGVVLDFLLKYGDDVIDSENNLFG